MVAKFCLQPTQRRRNDPGGPDVSAHPRPAALSAVVSDIYSSSRIWDLFLKYIYASSDGGAGVGIKGSPDWKGAFLLRPPFWTLHTAARNPVQESAYLKFDKLNKDTEANTQAGKVNIIVGSPVTRAGEKPGNRSIF